MLFGVLVFFTGDHPSLDSRCESSFFHKWCFCESAVGEGQAGKATRFNRSDEIIPRPCAGPAQVLPAEPKSTLEHDIDRYISVLAKYQFIRNDKALHPSLRRVAGQPDICVTSP